MTIDAMLAAHDATAFEALASKGLVRCALRDADAGLAEITKRGDDQATVMIDGQQVVITPAGPRPGDCPCPATGLCRHVLTAILTLRRDHGAQAAGPSVHYELLGVAEADLIKFAGPDLDAALRVAAAQPALSQEGSTLAVQLPDFADPVQFISRRTLKNAVFKGPDARGRLPERRRC